MRTAQSAPMLAALLFTVALPATADTTEARCDVYPKGQDRATSTGACRFSQRQGFVSIQWPDGKRYELHPDAKVAGNYTDQDGKPAYRQRGLGKDGLIFRMATESVYVYWDASTLQAMNNPDANSATAPYSTADYDATALLPCSFGPAARKGNCPIGILRGDAGSASIRIMKPDGEERILNFEGDIVKYAGWRDPACLTGWRRMVYPDRWAGILSGAGCGAGWRLRELSGILVG